MDIRVSAIMPVFNSAPRLGVALNSIAMQTSPPFETIVVDDGSTDESASIARSFEGRIPRLTIFEQQNSGAGAARNRAIASARGDWLAFLDSDDEWVAEKLRRLANCVAGNPEADFIHTDRGYLFPDGTRRPQSNYRPQKMSDKEFLFSGFHIKTSTVSVSRRVVESSGARFAEDLRTCEDYQFFWRCIPPARSVRYLDSPDTIVHETPGSLTRQENAAEILRDNIEMTSRICGDPITSELKSRLKILRYRCAQSLLLKLRKQSQNIYEEYAFLAAHLGQLQTVRAYASMLNGKSIRTQTV